MNLTLLSLDVVASHDNRLDDAALGADFSSRSTVTVSGTTKPFVAYAVPCGVVLVDAATVVADAVAADRSAVLEPLHAVVAAHSPIRTINVGWRIVSPTFETMDRISRARSSAPNPCSVCARGDTASVREHTQISAELRSSLSSRLAG